jgi:hypothetical protein
VCLQIYVYHLRSILHINISILTYNNVTLTEKKKGLLSLFILERLFRLLLYVYIFSLFYYFIIIYITIIIVEGLPSVNRGLI